MNNNCHQSNVYLTNEGLEAMKKSTRFLLSIHSFHHSSFYLDKNSFIDPAFTWPRILSSRHCPKGRYRPGDIVREISSGRYRLGKYYPEENCPRA